jgi:nucleotide-binding universal stress UspA family protein
MEGLRFIPSMLMPARCSRFDPTQIEVAWAASFFVTEMPTQPARSLKTKEPTMSPLRSILVHLDPSPRSRTRLMLALDVAEKHGAHVTALYGCTPSILDMPYSLNEGAAAALPVLEQLDTERRDDARAVFDSVISTGPWPLHWRELRGEFVVSGVARHAMCSDLMVLGQHDPSDSAALATPSDFIASVMMASGKPALIIPYANACKTLAQEVLIAWAPTRESARALMSALPFLQQAQRIHLVVQADSTQDGAAASSVESYLKLHDVRAPIKRHVALPTDSVGEALLSLAADTFADLLVMGCYSHSRARELVFGGASRTMLKSMTLPVLMAH